MRNVVRVEGEITRDIFFYYRYGKGEARWKVRDGDRMTSVVKDHDLQL